MATKRILYISASIGLGHVYRDLDIVGELRQQVPAVEVKWLAAEPASMVLKQAGETLLAEAALYANDSAIAEGAATGMRLNLFDYAFRSRQASAHNVQLFRQVIEREPFDVVVADEAYEIAAAGVDGPSMRRSPFVMIFDFIALMRRPTIR